MAPAPVRVLGHADHAQVVSLLNRDPVANVFVASRVRVSGVEPLLLGCELLGYFDEQGRLESMLHHGANLVPVSATERALDAFADRPVHNLSFGQKKRVCIAGVLAMEPQLLILDEPMAGLDQAMRAELLAVFDHLHSQGITMLQATHDIDFAYRWADHIHVMVGGRCSAAFAVTDFPKHTEALRTAGLPVPGIIELHQRLVAHGLLDAGDAPRSLPELIERLPYPKITKETSCC